MDNKDLDKAIDNVVDEHYQQRFGGNYPWGAKSELEKETEKQQQLRESLDPRAKNALNEITRRIERGPIHLEGKQHHPFMKHTIDTLYAKRAQQPVIETTVAIPYHLVDAISDDLKKVITECRFKLSKPFTVYHDKYDNAGVLSERKVGSVHQYHIKDFQPNTGSITATIEGPITWNK